MKFKAMLLFVLLLFVQTANAQTMRVGDVNADNSVDISDIVAIINVIAGNSTFTSAADVNNDGQVDISDIVAVINIIATGDEAFLNGYCPDTHHPHLIDMGDAGLWYCCNLGADAPWKTGDFYAWGEIAPKETYTWANYLHCNGSQDTCHDLGDNIAGTEYDVVAKTVGENLCVPTRLQTAELGKLSKEWTTVNGVPGYKITAANGNKIFLPAGGWKGESVYLEGKRGAYWTASLDKNYGQQMAFSMSLESYRFVAQATTNRFCGFTIRPVVGEDKDPAVSLGYCPDSNHPHVIDMGSLGKWACCNVGASAPWEEGAHYAWGETEPKDDYTWENYSLCDGSKESCYDIGNDIAGTDYDVACKKWGTDWNMPSYEQLYALHESTNTFGQLNHVKGVTFTADNGNKVFLPACGHKRDGYSFNPDPAIYWASTRKSSLHASVPNIADAHQRSISEYYGVYSVYNSPRYYGGSVRAINIKQGTNPENPENPDPNVDQSVTLGYCPDENHPHVIDMGSAGKWACCNIGSKKPADTGGYYCWGGTKELSFYGATPENETACIWGEDIDGNGTEWWGYKWGMWTDEGILRGEYDVAHMQWGGSWHLPTMSRFETLNGAGFTKENAKLNGTPGLKVTASNGNRIFIPYCGRKVEAEFLYDKYNPMEYWTATSVTAFQGWCLEPNAAAMHHNYWYDPTDGETPEDPNTDFVQVHQARGTGLPVRAVQ